MDFYLGAKWTSESAFKSFPRDVWIVKHLSGRVVKSWFLVTSGVVPFGRRWVEAIDPVDRCNIVFRFYKWLVLYGIPRIASIYPDYYYLLLKRSFALVCLMLLCSYF